VAGFLGISPYWDAFLGNLAGPLLLQLRPLQAAIFFFLAAPKLMFFFFEKIKLMIFGCFFGFDPYSCPAGFVELWWCVAAAWNQPCGLRGLNEVSRQICGTGVR